MVTTLKISEETKTKIDEVFKEIVIKTSNIKSVYQDRLIEDSTWNTKVKTILDDWSRLSDNSNEFAKGFRRAWLSVAGFSKEDIDRILSGFKDDNELLMLAQKRLGTKVETELEERDANKI